MNLRVELFLGPAQDATALRALTNQNALWRNALIALFYNAQTIVVIRPIVTESLNIKISTGMQMNIAVQNNIQHMRSIRLSKGVIAFLILSGASCFTLAKLPEATQAEKALMQQNISRQTLLTKQDAFESCVAQNKIVKKYQDSLRAQGKAIPVSMDTGPCTDPSTFKADGGTPIGNRPIEASEAHSPPGTAVTAPSSKMPQSELPMKK